MGTLKTSINSPFIFHFLWALLIGSLAYAGRPCSELGRESLLPISEHKALTTHSLLGELSVVELYEDNSNTLVANPSRLKVVLPNPSPAEIGVRLTVNRRGLPLSFVKIFDNFLVYASGKDSPESFLLLANGQLSIGLIERKSLSVQGSAPLSGDFILLTIDPFHPNLVFLLKKTGPHNSPKSEVFTLDIKSLRGQTPIQQSHNQNTKENGLIAPVSNFGEHPSSPRPLSPRSLFNLPDQTQPHEIAFSFVNIRNELVVVFKNGESYTSPSLDSPIE